MGSDIDWQDIQTAETMLALHQGSVEFHRMRQSQDGAAGKSDRAEKSPGYAGAISEQTSFDETRKAEAIKAYLAQKSRHR